MNNSDIHNLVLSGGGIKGITILGALQLLYEKKILDNVLVYAGSSVGGLIASLLNINYKPQELFNIIKKISYKKIVNIKFDTFLFKYGFDDGSKMNKIISTLFKNKKIDTEITFIELYNLTKKKLILTGTCVNTQKLQYFSYIETPDMKVINAIRATISIPLYFTPVLYNNDLYIDGSCCSNYPINLFDNELEHTLGINIDSDVKHEIINNIESYFINIANCLKNNIFNNLTKNYEKYTIKLIINDVSSIDFNLTKKKKEELYNYGYKTAELFLIK